MTKKCLTIKEVEKINNCVLVYGHFSSIHHGHIRYLKNASKKASKLIVALMGDDENSFKFSQAERAEGLSSIELIYKIVLLKKNELAEAVRKLKPKELVLGKEFENNQINRPEHLLQICSSYLTGFRSLTAHAADPSQILRNSGFPWVLNFLSYLSYLCLFACLLTGLFATSGYSGKASGSFFRGF